MAKNNLDRVIPEVFALEGGLDLVSPALALRPGNVLDSVNFENDLYGGYRRMYGIERYDGRTSPSSADYTVFTVSTTAAISVGNTITGGTSSKTAVVISIPSSTELIATKVSGAFTVGEDLKVGGVTKATLSSTLLNGGSTPQLHATYKNLAADNYRADIAKPTGTGPIRGVWYYNGDIYCFRDNNATPATSCGMWKATTGGWTAVSLGTEVQFTTGSVAEPVDGATLTQGGVTATVRRVVTRTGTWTGTAAGTFVITGLAGGHFAAGAASLSGGATVALTGVETAITLSPGGRYEFVNTNFAGTTDTFRMYGCDGVNHMFEFDGTYFVPIRTGIATDAPKYIAAWKNMLVCAVKSSVQVSGIGDPYSWTALTGAAELATGDVVSGLLPQPGNASTGAIAIYTAGNTNKTYILYGNDTSDFNLVPYSDNSGAQPYTVQNIGYGYALDTKGITSLQTTLSFGNFISSTLTRKIQPLIDSKRGLATASCIVRGTNQYRLFFSDGTGIILYMQATETAGNQQVQGDVVGGLMYFDYSAASIYCNTVVSYVDSSGLEHIMAAGSDGMVYELDKGTSHDGAAFQARLFLAFNSNKSPRTIKRYRRTVLQATCKNTADVHIGYELNFGSSETQSGYRGSNTLFGGGGYWDTAATWDIGTWDAPYVSEYTIDTPGNGRNIGLLIYGESDENEPFTVHSAITMYMRGRLERS